MNSKRLSSLILGNPEVFSLEARLYNVSCLLMVLLAGVYSFQLSSFKIVYIQYLDYFYIFAVVFWSFAFVLSRIKRVHQPFIPIMWFFVILLFAALWFIQAGSHGTVGYMMLPTITLLLILTPSDTLKKTMAAAISIECLALVLVDYYRPDLIIPYPTKEDRLFDFLATVVPAYIMMAIVGIYFVGNYRRIANALTYQKNKIESLTVNMRRYLPLQLVESLASGESAQATTAHRIRVTIFFSDIKDFTPTTEHLQPEDLTKILNVYLTEMTRIATKWGGMIDKFVGDAMMVIFGAPVSKGEDVDAQNCVQMAIEVQNKMKDLNANWYKQGIESPLEIRIGIHTGIATVGDFGAEDRLSYTAIGGEVNLASRLEQLCNPGGILISHATWAFVNEKVGCVARAKKASVKGIARELTVYDVVMA
jgi:class 3 adenylate cyclase